MIHRLVILSNCSDDAITKILLSLHNKSRIFDYNNYNYAMNNIIVIKKNATEAIILY